MYSVPRLVSFGKSGKLVNHAPRDGAHREQQRTAMDLRQLRYFVGIVQAGSLSRAADQLHVAQSAISHHLASLESEVGRQLVTRGPKGILLTEAGGVLYRHAEAILRHVEFAKHDALSAQNVVLPAGDQKIGGLDFMVQTNSSPLQVPTFNNLPIKTVNGATVYLRDVAYVHRGAPPQTNAVLVKGRQSVLIQIFKSGDASTLAVVAGIKQALPGIIRTLPPGVKITPLNDASGFVRDSVAEVVQEMVTAAILTGLTVLLFYGDGNLRR